MSAARSSPSGLHHLLPQLHKILHHSLSTCPPASPTPLPWKQIRLQQPHMLSAVKACPCPSPSPWNLSCHPSPVYLVNSPATSPTMPSLSCVPPWETYQFLFCYSHSTFCLHSLMDLSIDYGYLPCARHCPRDGNKMVSKTKAAWNTHSAGIQSGAASFFKLFLPQECHSPPNIIPCTGSCRRTVAK